MLRRSFRIYYVPLDLNEHCNLPWCLTGEVAQALILGIKEVIDLFLQYLPIRSCPPGSKVNQPDFERSRMDAANRRLFQMAQTSRLRQKWSSWLQIYIFNHRIGKHCRLSCTFRILIGLDIPAPICFGRLAFDNFYLVTSVSRLGATVLPESTGTVRRKYRSL